MGEAGLEIRLDTKDAQAAIWKVIQHVNPNTITKLIGQEFLAWIDKNFRAQGIEEKWKPLSRNTIAGRRVGGGKGPIAAILQNTGKLKQSFVPGGSGNLFSQDDTHVTVGSGLIYASWHEEGTDPYTIQPSSKPYLVFPVAVQKRSAKGRFKKGFGQSWVKTKEVHHPGLPARHMLPSEKAATGMALGVIKGILAKATAK